MIPHDLPAARLDLPATTDHSIVLITGAMGSGLPYERFALRMQEEFGDRVVAWFRYQPKPQPRGGSSLIAGAKRVLREELRSAYERPARAVRWPRKLWGVYQERIRRRNALAIVQRKLFAEEVEALRRFGKLEPIPVEDPTAPEFIEQVKRFDPYFFLSLGGPLYPAELLRSVRGIALNQHAGWSPDYRGAHTVYWALYHRRLDCIGATVHKTISGADAGPIFRRSQACLLGNEDALACFSRVVALGTELMCETVREIIADKRPWVFEQPPGRGQTYQAREMDRPVREWIAQDHADHWLAAELQRCRKF